MQTSHIHYALITGPCFNGVIYLCPLKDCIDFYENKWIGLVSGKETEWGRASMRERERERGPWGCDTGRFAQIKWLTITQLCEWQLSPRVRPYVWGCLPFRGRDRLADQRAGGCMNSGNGSNLSFAFTRETWELSNHRGSLGCLVMCSLFCGSNYSFDSDSFGVWIDLYGTRYKFKHLFSPFNVLVYIWS